MIKYSIGSIFLSLLFTFVLMMIFGEMKVPVSIGAAGLTGCILNYWFVKKQQRIPTKNERNIILIIYGIGIALFFIVLGLNARKVNTSGIMVVTLIALSYPLFLSFIFNEKLLNDFHEKYNKRSTKS